MLKCQKCKRITEKNEPTGKFIFFKKWEDKKGKEHKDIIKSLNVCLDCVGEEEIKK